MIYEIPINLSVQEHSYDVSVGSGLLATSGARIRSVAGDSAERAVIISNRRVNRLFGHVIERSLEEAGFTVSTFLIGDGEKYKTLRTAESVLDFLGSERISRTDVIVALGGGVVGDLAGFAAAIHLRGIRFFQLPTTLMAMVDSSVGGKTGINTKYGKNMVGAFYQPTGVYADIDTLRSLPPREMRAGFCEAIKQGAVGGKELFRRTEEFLHRYPLNGLLATGDLSGRDSALSKLVADQITFKAKIVMADERESAGNNNRYSRKVLNFGHTFAHALEKVTDFKYLLHGEAVGYGILFAAELSKRLELLASDDISLLYDVVHRLGQLPAIDHIEPSDIIAAFAFDKKVIGRSLQWILLRGIGKPVIVDSANIDPFLIKDLLERFLSQTKSS
ncbi:MAG TPA: 3-dehydroquinate synthase [Pyrinomonadaceae bacterium]|mgnify:CR=1 FL=1|nr:3-dehydroquinate synthase [Blastocatellia bacterium]HRJ88503.1 3-dehydroquinate synthase [Pyrinomonadaceae bacterium]HRK50450.1 3-dehydroquinate synthase [Pyrinomonadaceae bacterium]